MTLGVPLTHMLSAMSALVCCVQYGRSIGIARGEWIRYLKKAFGLALCYAGFARPGAVREAWKAGEAAFLCCAYDVVTDWRGFSPGAWRRYEEVLQRGKLPAELRAMAAGLYEGEIRNSLADDGLERGSIALRFVLKLMGCENARAEAWGDLDDIGQLLQIVDDILDYEKGLSLGETNCLTSPRREHYLRKLRRMLAPAEACRLFGEGGVVLVKVIAMSQKKAERLLDHGVATSVEIR